MSRISAMTIGLVMIMIGAQLFLVRSYYLSPKTARFLTETFGEDGNGTSWQTDRPAGFSMNGQPGQSWPFYQANGLSSAPLTRFASNSVASMQSVGQQRIAPPRWMCWPVLFLGTVFFLHGVALRGD